MKEEEEKKKGEKLKNARIPEQKNGVDGALLSLTKCKINNVTQFDRNVQNPP